MSWEKGLTDEQRTAASHSGKNARLLAGPGTGKTLTLTRRIVYLIEAEDVKPDEMMALTFTRAAVAELKSRLEGEVGPQRAGEVRVSTLHSFALRELLRHAARTKLPQPLRIADDWEERNIVVEELKTLLGKTVEETSDLLERLSADWQTLAADRSDWERNFPDPRFLGGWQQHRRVYGYTLRSELVYQLKNALEEGAIDLRASVQHVLIDEYQDLNPCDLAIARAFAQNRAEVYGAGDDDQSIYGFRYANPEGIRRFVKEFHPAEKLTLEKCQRCDDKILGYGLYVARQDPRREDKPLTSVSVSGAGDVHLMWFQDQGYEAIGISKICKWLCKRKKVKPDSILILLRSDRHQVFSKPLRAALLSEAVPVGIVSNPLEPLDTNAGRELLSLLRLTLNNSDSLAWRTVLQVRSNLLGVKTLMAIYELSRSKAWSYSKGVSEIANRPSLIGGKGPTVAAEYASITKLISRLGPPPKQDVVVWIQSAADQVIADDESRDAVVEVFRRVSKVAGVDSLESLLKALNVSLGDFEQEKPRDTVSIMTMHQAKGLTADAVIVAAAEDEYIPGRNISGDLSDDERRLLYVSLTRARHFLYVTYCRQRTGAQRHTGRTPGNSARTLTQFLSGGPLKPEPGYVFADRLR